MRVRISLAWTISRSLVRIMRHCSIAATFTSMIGGDKKATKWSMGCLTSTFVIAGLERSGDNIATASGLRSEAGGGATEAELAPLLGGKEGSTSATARPAGRLIA